MSLQDLSDTNVTSNEQEVPTTGSISGLPSESYFRVAFQQSSGQSYFGYMKNNVGDWVKIMTSQDCHNYFKVSDASTSALILIVKIGEDNSVDNGNYTLKLRRYTSSCSSYSDSNAIFVALNLPTPSPSPTLSPTSNPTSTPIPSKTPSPSPTPARTPSPKPTPTPSPTPLNTPEEAVLGESTVFPSPPATEPPLNLTENPKIKLPLLAIGLIALGVGLIGFSVFSIIKSAKKSYTIESENKNNQIS